MVVNSEASGASGTLSAELVDELEALDESELRAVIDYSQERLRAYHADVTASIEPREGEEIVRIEDQGRYTQVVKRQPCAEGCPDCPHGPFLYHVRQERQLDGSTSLHWVYLGRARE